MTVRTHKYKAIPTVYKGHRYDSKAEAKFAATLDLMLDAGEIDWWLRQVSIDLGEDTRYRVDFLIQDQSGVVYAVDVKGMETASWRRNKKLWKKYGPFDLHVVKGGVTAEVVPGTG